MNRDRIRAAMEAHAASAKNAPPRLRVDSPTRLSYWFPRVQAAGLPVPRTHLVVLSDEEMRDFDRLFDGETPACWNRLLADIRYAATAPGLGVGVPFFLRTDFTSAKHDWQHSCFVADLDRLGHHVYALAEFSAMADMVGGMPPDTFVVRELLKTAPAFTAFHGRMPITREFRYFVRDSVIEHSQPYWPPAAIEDHGPDVSDWRERLTRISTLENDEHGELATLTQLANVAVPGFWSVDWLETERGWVLTDMAEGDTSFRWEPPA